MDNDTTSTKEGHYKILKEFSERKADILVGTQMIAKGHDFPNVTLVGILDADITGPSIPKSFGVTEMAMGSQLGIYPNETKEGIKMMSVNLLVEDPNRPVIFRGPALGSLIQQFYSNVMWGELDYLFIDMPSIGDCFNQLGS